MLAFDGDSVKTNKHLSEVQDGNLPTLAVNKIFRAIEGEGINIGMPEVFVRLQGCQIGCRYCDAPAALKRLPPNYTPAAVLAEVERLGLTAKRLSITGGDPLAAYQRKGLGELLHLAKEAGYWINLEDHGLTPLADAQEVYAQVDFISADFKTPAGGSCGKRDFLQALLQNYPHKLQIKSVIMDERDFQWALQNWQALRPWPPTVAWVLTPAFNLGEALPTERIKQIYDWNYQAGGIFKVIIQQHKVVFGANRDDV